MPTKLEEKQKELELRQLQVLRLQEEIAQLNIATKPESEPTLPTRYPLGQRVTLSGRNEKYRLRDKRAVVIGHTPCYVKLQRKGEQFLRVPENLTIVRDDDKEAKSYGSQGTR